MAPKNLNDKIFDAMLDVAAEEVQEQRLREWEALEGEPHVFSPEFERTIKRLIRKSKRGVWARKAKHFLNRAAAVLAIFVMVGFALTMSVSAVRVQVLNTIIEYGEKFFGVRFGGAADENAGNAVYVYPEYIPDGYEMEFDNEMPIGKDILYSNGETGDSIGFLQLLKSEGMGHTFDGEHADMPYELMDQGRSLLIFESNTEGYPSYIVWESDAMFYELSASLPVDEIVKIAKSIPRLTKVGIREVT
jgi:hypothetical protein